MFLCGSGFLFINLNWFVFEENRVNDECLIGSFVFLFVDNEEFGGIDDEEVNVSEEEDIVISLYMLLEIEFKL